MYWCYCDVIDVVVKGGEWLDLIMIFKVGCVVDIYVIDMFVI